MANYTFEGQFSFVKYVNVKHLLSVACMLFFQTTSYSQTDLRPSDPKMLGELIFKSFQDENFSSYLEYIFTEADCDTMAKYADAPDSMKLVVVKHMKGRVNHIRNTARDNFEVILSTALQNGVKWNKVKLEDVKFEIKNRNNVQSADIFLFCRSGKKLFQIKLDNCHKSDAWLLMDYAEIRFYE